MKFSIVITTYNRLPLLKRAIASCLEQTYPCEVVIADDGSSDGTQEYIETLGHRVVYHRNSKNLGHSATVNAGVEIAQGDWIKLLDDDDYLAPNCIEMMVKALANRPEAAICSCQAIQVDPTGAEVSRTQKVGSPQAVYIAQEDVHYGMLMEMVPFGTPVQVAVQREAFLQSGGWDDAFTGNCDDINSWIKVAKYGDAVFINKCLAYRTIWTGNHSSHLSPKARLEANLLIKQQIYELVNTKYRNCVPQLEDIKAFLHLHWSLVSLKNKRLGMAWELALPYLMSIKTWIYFGKVVYSRRIKPNLQLVQYQEIVPQTAL